MCRRNRARCHLNDAARTDQREGQLVPTDKSRIHDPRVGVRRHADRITLRRSRPWIDPDLPDIRVTTAIRDEIHAAAIWRPGGPAVEAVAARDLDRTSSIGWHDPDVCLHDLFGAFFDPVEREPTAVR